MEPLDQLVSSVLTSAKYQHIAPELVQAIGAQELQKRRTLKEAIKATKNKLHQIAGAYHADKPNYAGWQRTLQAAPDSVTLQQTCRQIMQQHASTRERLPILAEFYPTLLAGLPPIRSVLDLACGLNPLTLPWLPLAAGAHYYACDIYQDQVAFLNGLWPRFGVQGAAFVCDLLQTIPTTPVDVAFLYKTIPCLEQVDKTIGLRLLAAIQAPILFVSFPAQSLGGGQKGMSAYYENHFRELIAPYAWAVERFTFATELVFRVVKG
jgi:16S rRNA (guanine(1405)-N(7))-methyltransferase